MMIKLTIVTPTFNRVEKLKRNFESILCQTFKDIEHIIVDNMSEDGTEKIVKEYQEKASYPVIYLREKDAGVYNAMNKGIKRAKGQWIHILNSDDVYYSEKSVQYIVDEKNDPYDVLVGSIIIDIIDEGRTVCWKPFYDEKLKHYNFPHPGTIVKNDFYKAYGYYDERFKVVSDSIFNIKNYPKANYKIIDEILVIMDGSGLSSRISLRNTYEFLYHILFYHKFPLIEKLKRIIDYFISISNKSLKNKLG